MAYDPNQGKVKLDVEVAVVDKNTGERSQIYKGPDPGTVQLSQLMCANILNTTQTTVVKDTTNTARTVSANTAITGVNIVAGTGTGAGAVTDYTLSAKSATGQGTKAGTIGAVNTTSGAFTITANMDAPSGSTIVYGEIGIEVTTASYSFLIARGTTGGTWSVDTSHYLAVTYTITPS
jgi:hypothetical protein